jgi:D-alanyl-D-alanine carboxypeptidase
VQGVDGIKTGYTDASGYNLVSSVRRNDRHIVAVVLGGSSNAARDTRMQQLIEQHISQAATQRTAPMITEMVGQHEYTPAAASTAPATPAAAPAVVQRDGAGVVVTKTSVDQNQE